MSTHLDQAPNLAHSATLKPHSATAWQLIGLTLRYYGRMLLIGYGLVSVITVMVLAIVVLIEKRDVGVVFLLAIALFVGGSMTMATMINANETSERRLRVLLLLPTRHTSVHWARFLTPLLVNGIGIGIGLLLITIQRLSGVAGPVIDPLHALNYIASLTSFYIYFPTLFPDLAMLWRAGRRPQAVAAGAVIAIGMLFLACLQLTGAWKRLEMGWLLPLPALACAALSLYLFRHRPSFT
jgi:hypothetical protein